MTKHIAASTATILTHFQAISQNFFKRLEGFVDVTNVKGSPSFFAFSFSSNARRFSSSVALRTR